MVKMRTRAHAACLLLVCPTVFIAAAAPAFAQAPGQVNGLIWCAGTKDCLSWSGTAGANEYRLYSGSFGSLPDLLNTNADSCRISIYVATTTGPSLSDQPDPCGVFWYLVTAANGFGEGPAGNATAGARVLDAPGLCQP